MDAPPTLALKEGGAWRFGKRLTPKPSCPDLIRTSRAEDRARKQIGLARAIDPQATPLPPIPFRRGADDHFRLLATRLTAPEGEFLNTLQNLECWIASAFHHP